MAHVSGISPRLPQDLERLIFERAASGGESPLGLMRLLLVAKRVHEWTRPIIYRVFVQLSDHQFPDFGNQTSKMKDLGRFAEHLMLRHSRYAEAILSSCPNVYDLAFRAGPATMSRYLPLIRDLPLTRLSANLVCLSPDQLLELPFLNLTHLNISGFPGSRWGTWAVLADLPKLSHIAINFFPATEVLRKLLLHCAQLKILVLLIDEEEATIQIPAKYLAVQDSRFVLMEVRDGLQDEQDWIAGAIGMVDFWITAEWFSAARKGDLLLDSSQRWIQMSVNWENELNDRGKEWYFSIPAMLV